MVNSNISNYLSLKTAVSEQIQDKAKLFASIEGKNLHGAKITLYMYTVFSLWTQLGPLML